MALTGIVALWPDSGFARKLDDDRMFQVIVRTWASAFLSINDAEISQALKYYERSGNQFPPGLPEFGAQCRANQKPREYIPLPDPTIHNRRADISGLPMQIKNELERIGLKPDNETTAEYAQRCRKYLIENHGELLPAALRS